MESKLDSSTTTPACHSKTLDSNQQPDDWQRANRLEFSLQAFRQTVGERFSGCTVRDYIIENDHQRHVVDRLREYGQNLERNIANGVNLILFGAAGTGKDHLTASLMREAMRQDYTMDDYHGRGKGGIGWIRGADLLADIGQRFFDKDNPWRPTALTRPKVLVISDLVPSDGRLTDFQQSQLLRIVDSRYCQLKPVWITANIANREQLEAALGVPVADRLCHGALTLFFNWPSFRQR